MSAPIEGVLNHVQRESLEIDEFIFHIIEPASADTEPVVFLDEVQLQPKQKDFFLNGKKWEKGAWLKYNPASREARPDGFSGK